MAVSTMLIFATKLDHIGDGAALLWPSCSILLASSGADTGKPAAGLGAPTGTITSSSSWPSCSILLLGLGAAAGKPAAGLGALTGAVTSSSSWPSCSNLLEGLGAAAGTRRQPWEQQRGLLESNEHGLHATAFCRCWERLGYGGCRGQHAAAFCRC